MTTISVPVLLAHTSRSPLRSSIFQLDSSRLLPFGLLPQPLLPYSLCKMALYRRLFLPSYFWLYASLSLAIHPFYPKIRYFMGWDSWFFPNILSAAFLYFLYRLGCCVWFFFYGEFLFLQESAHRTFTQPYSCFVLPILTVFWSMCNLDVLLPSLWSVFPDQRVGLVSPLLPDEGVISLSLFFVWVVPVPYFCAPWNLSATFRTEVLPAS